jgi:hypothetical protein
VLAIQVFDQFNEEVVGNRSPIETPLWDAVESFVTIRPAVDFSTQEDVLVIARGRAGRGATP